MANKCSAWWLSMAIAFSLFLAFAALIVWAVVAGLRKERQRAEGMRAVADQLGLAYLSKGDPALFSTLSQFKLFTLGSSKKMGNLLLGTTDDVEVALFDYQYNLDSDDTVETKHQSVISVSSPRLNLPDFTLCPENFLHRVGQIFGYQDIDFESHPMFSKAFLLRGSDEERIRQVFDNDILAFFEGAIGVCAEAVGDRLIFYRSGVRVDPTNLRSIMDEGFKVYTLFRSHGEPEHHRPRISRD